MSYMAESSIIDSGMSESEIVAMREALSAQQQLLQKLHAELDVERESSATAVSEALSMILKLQGEKSAVAMEASQYKRMAEEKICHAEESLALYEDLVYQKEMEIAALEFQVQAYKCKLLSLGYSDLSVEESKFSENVFSQKSEGLSGETGVSGTVRRLKSLPPIQLKDGMQRKSAAIKRERSLTPGSDGAPTPVEEKTVGDMNSYWEQIKKLDKKVKEINATPSCDQKFTELVKDAKTQHEREVDKFEVPQVDEHCQKYQNDYSGPNKLIWEGESQLGKSESTIEKIFESCDKDETESVKTMLLSHNQGRILRTKSIEGLARADYKMAPIPPKKKVSTELRLDIQELNRRLERLEAERNARRREIVEEGGEGLNLLKEIREQLNTIQSEMRSWKGKTKKSESVDNPSLNSLKETMMHFWL